MHKILIVDDHPIVAEGLRNLVKDSGIAEVVGVAGTAKSCLDFLRWEKPDIIFLDINLPDMQGTELCKIIKQKNPAQKILALTTFNERSVVTKMIDNGADGYILKNSDSSEIVDAIKELAAGSKYLSGEVESILSRKPEQELILTKREKEVLAFIADGLTNNEIAEKLFISPLTVDSHRKNLITKLEAKNTASLIKIAVERKLI